MFLIAWNGKNLHLLTSSCICYSFAMHTSRLMVSVFTHSCTFSLMFTCPVLSLKLGQCLSLATLGVLSHAKLISLLSLNKVYINMVRPWIM